MGVAGAMIILTARWHRQGRIAVAIHDLKLPIACRRGEAIDGLMPFSPEEYVDALFEEKG